MFNNSLAEDFLPSISMKCTKEKISPIRTSKNRLSRSFLKVKSNVNVINVCKEKVDEDEGFVKSENVRMNNPIVLKHAETDALKETKGSNFCPNCQIPFDLLKISADLHTQSCTTSNDTVEECPYGEFCYSNNSLHYRDYAHKYLAQLRASGKKLEHQACHTPSTSNKRQYGNCSTSSQSKKKKQTPNTHLSSEYRKRIHFGDDTANNLSYDDDLISRPIRDTVSRKLVDESETTDTFHQNSLSSDNLFCLPQPRLTVAKKIRNASPPYNGTLSKQINDRDAEHRGKHSTSRFFEKEKPGLKTEASVLPENVAHTKETIKLKAKTFNLSNKKEMENTVAEDSELQIVYESISSNDTSRHVLVSEKSNTEHSDSLELISASDGYTSKAGIGASEEQAIANEFFSESLWAGSENMLSKTSVAKSNSTLPSKCNRRNSATSMIVNTSGSSYYSPSKKLKGKDIQLPCSQNLITSYFQCSKTKLSEVPTTSCVTEQKTSKTEVSDNTSSTKENNEATAQKWRQIATRLRNRGYSALRVNSDDSSLSSGQSSKSGMYKREKRNCPFYKKIPGTDFVVDAFSYGIIPGVTVYFLSHFHFDHYGGLNKSFSQPIYCSEITAKLAQMKLHVHEKYLHILQIDEPIKINGVVVTALDANHCPGSLMFLFQLSDGRNFLHVGDFRADPKMESYPCFWNLTIDKLFLDTTYCEPRYKFPAQTEIIAKVVNLAKKHAKALADTVFICGSYTIGKEKIFTAVAEAIDCKIWAGGDKRRVLKCLKDPVIDKRLTTNQAEARVHVCPMSQLNRNDLYKYMEQIQAMCSYLVAFIPTGWETKKCGPGDINMTVYGNITIYGIPYSEHSSFSELRRFVQFLRPLEIIPTVNMESAVKRAAMEKHFKEWLAESPIAKASQNLQQKMEDYFRASKQ